MNDSEGMRLAIDAAERGLAAGEAPIGAALVRDGELISARYTEEHTQSRRLVHADFLALDQADRLNPTAAERARSKLYLTLEPCMFCMGAAAAFGVAEIHYALEAPVDGAVALGLEWSKRAASGGGYSTPMARGGLLRVESLALLRRFAAEGPPGGVRRWAQDFVALFSD
jgi:tRNA(adenine34) deaminase